MNTEILIIILSTSILFLRIGFFLIGFFRENKRTKNPEPPVELPFVSVIVPARNEEANIEQCIRSLKELDYPSNKFEIIAVNDRSTDNTRSILESLQKDTPNLKIVNLENDEQKDGIPGKAGTIHIGVKNSKGKIIFNTDADCTVPQKWLLSLVGIYNEPGVGFLTSYTSVTGNRLFDKIQSIEWIYMNTMGMGGVGMNQPMGCYGNNLTFLKSAYESIGGYKNIPFSVTEDLSLQQAMFKNNYKVRYYIGPNALVNTKPCSNFKEYISQHHRWARGGLTLGWRAVFFVLSSFSLWGGMLYFLTNLLFPFFFLLLFIRFFCDFLLLAYPLKILKKEEYFRYLPIAIPFFLFVELIIPFIVWESKVHWKGQVFETT
ncbi:MAG: glycosyltransferase [Ignavibacteria bacterium]|nr:glycosyltransferase [Ignavibacteria bacterium]